uniref:heparinase II/III domain-containing protein n=1 Tax=Microbacterium sp. TaxID=51671 RepID=UPI00289E9CF5
VLLAREHAGTTAGLGLVIKGGHNAEHHNHNDVGSFIVTSDGVPVVVDAGRPTYTKATFGPDRYSIWTMQSSWHNTPTIAGVDQSAGREFAASDVEAVVADAASSLSLELGGAYDVDGATWRRTAVLDRTRGIVRVTDEANPPSTGAPSTLNLVIAGGVSALDDGVRVVPLDGAAPVVVRWPAGIRSAHTVRLLDDPMLSEVWGERLTRIELDVSTHDRAWITVERDDAIPGTGDSEDDR